MSGVPLRSLGSLAALLTLTAASGCLPGVVLEPTSQQPPGVRSLCPENHTAPGDAVVVDDDSLAALAGCTAVNGSLVVADTLLEHLALPSIETVGGDVEVRDNTKLADVSLPALRSVGGAILIIDRTSEGVPLAAVDLTALETGGVALGRLAEAPLAPTSCAVDARDASLKALDALALPSWSGGSVLVVVDTELTALSTPALTSLDGDVCFVGNGALTVDGAPLLASAGSLNVTGNDTTSTASFPSLASLTAGLQVLANPLLAHLDLPLLTDLGGAAGTAAIADNPLLPECEAELVVLGALGNLTGPPPPLHLSGNLVEDLRIEDDAALGALSTKTCVSGRLHVGGTVTSFAPLTQLTYVSGNLEIVGTSVADVELPALAGVGRALAIERNAATSVGFPALRGIGSPLNESGAVFPGISIGQNDALTSLNLANAHFIGSSAGIQIFSNPALSTCAASALRDQVCGGLQGCFTSIFENAQDCADELSTTCTGGTHQGGPACPGYDACGDGRIDPGEDCDDNARIPLDGCDTNCFIEARFVCDDAEPSTCTSCGATGPCCGDASAQSPEQCDDGNTRAGDGCSATCTAEPGFTCSQTAGRTTCVGGGEGEGEGEGDTDVPCAPFAATATTVGLWHFEEATAPWSDASANNADITSGGGSAASFGPFGSALSLSDTQVSTTLSTPTLTSWTLEAWVDADASATGPFLTLAGGAAELATFSIDASGATFGVGGINLTSGVPLVNGFHHVAASCFSGGIRFTVDGTSHDSAATCPLALSTLSGITLGGAGFRGSLDEVRVLGRAKSIIELDAYATCGECTGAADCTAACTGVASCSEAGVCLCAP